MRLLHNTRRARTDLGIRVCMRIMFCLKRAKRVDMNFYDIKKLNKMENMFAMIISGRKYGKKKFKERIKMTKFKVGDQVRVKKNLKIGHKYGKDIFVKGMEYMRGEIAILTNIYCDGKKFGIKGSTYLLTPEMVEPVINKLIFNGNATILFKDGKKYVTKCDTSDTYDREKGLLTVLAKANGYNYEAIQEMLKNATIKGKDMQVREVKRKAKVGEYVKIINAKNAHNNYRNGDILKIIDADFYVRYGRYLGQFLYDTEYVVLENYKPKENKKQC